MLEVRANFNSSVEQVLDFKTCCGLRAFDQNLEILVRNTGDAPVTVSSVVDLEGPWGTRRIDNLMPHGEQVIAPGEIRAFYCMMEPALWEQATRLKAWGQDLPL